MKLESQSLGRFPRRDDGSVNWKGVPQGSVLESEDVGREEIERALARWMPDSDPLGLIWGSLAVPSVTVERVRMLGVLSDILETFPDFWMYAADVRVMVESSFAGNLTVARVR